MFLNSRFSNFNTTILKLIIIILLGICRNSDKVVALQCYVCGVDDGIECDRLNPTNSIFIQDCLPEAKSCGIRTHGNKITRTCEKHEFHDCQTANKVEYCYCLKALCNGNYINISDDEDLSMEGSGDNTQPVDKSQNEVIITSKNVNKSGQIHANYCYLVLLTLLYN